MIAEGQFKDNFINRYSDDKMPIAPVAEHMETFKAGAVTIGVEYRILTDELIASLGIVPDPKMGSVDDGGVSLHVFAKAADGDLERIRFDCFDEEPHYHYVSWGDRHNDVVYVDPSAIGDMLSWALERIRTRLPQMLEKAGVEDAWRIIDARQIEEILPLVAESAYRARFHSDRKQVSQGALAAGARGRA